jgi:NADH:ubiquinone oxidoreductase subunit K
MKEYRHILPVALAVAFGLLTLIGLLFVPLIGDALVSWASFLAAVALVLGVVNLLGIHARRASVGNPYSVVLIISALAIFVLALTDFLGLTTEGVTTAFSLVQAPLEAAVGMLLAFFLLFAGFRLLRDQRNGWALLFVTTAVVVMLAKTRLPLFPANIFGWLNDVISNVIVVAGMRGILIGVALGAVAVTLRILTGTERPYDK